MTLPYSRTLLVRVSRNDAFPARRGFGIMLFLTSQEVTGKLDPTHRTKAYSTLEEVAADFSTSDQAYKAALVAFGQDPRPVMFKVGFVNTATGFDMLTELGAIYSADQQWYWITHEAGWRDQVAIQEAILQYAQANEKFAMLDSNTATMKTQNNTNNIASKNKGLYDRGAVWWHSDATQYPAVAAAASFGTYNFDQPDAAYTGKFKKLEGIPPVNVNSNDIAVITGFLPKVGQSVAAGHMANTVVDIGGQYHTQEGSTLTPNVFIDEIHAADYIKARTEEELFGILLNNKRIPFTDQGMQLLASAPRTVMSLARRAGLVADDLDPITGKYKPAVIFDVPSVFDIPESQRKSRIAPSIRVKFRYAGAVHYATIDIKMTF